MRSPILLTEAIVLRMIPYGDSHLVVGLLTKKQGRLSAFASHARRSRRRFGSSLDLFCRVQVEVSFHREGSLGRLLRSDLVDPNFGLRKSLRTICAASHLSECIWNLIGEVDPHHALYDWFQATLKRLSHSSVSALEEMSLELELLALCGYAPRLDACLECGRSFHDEKVFFSFERGGLVCSNCRVRGQGKWMEFGWVRSLTNNEELSEESQASFREVLDGFVHHTVGRSLPGSVWRKEAGCVGV